MRRAVLRAGASALIALGSGARVGAQPLQPAPVGPTPRHEVRSGLATALAARGVPAVPVLATPRLVPDSLARPPRRRAPYVLGGALVGGVALGAVALRSGLRTDDAMFVGPFTAAAAGIGALAGGLLGWVIVEARREQDASLRPAPPTSGGG